MYLQWGDVFLKVIDLKRYERETVWTPDYCDLLSVKTVIGCVGTYAPGGDPRLISATSISANAGADIARRDFSVRNLNADLRSRDPAFTTPRLETDTTARIDPSVWRTGPETDVELRQHFQRARQKLILWAYARQTGQPFPWLESPRPGFTEDLKRGPRCIAFDVVAASGEPESIAVYVEFETEMSPCPSGSDRLVMSHRWEMSHEPDEHQYLTRVIEGTAIFNGAVLSERNFNPDRIRNQLIHPVPVGFERQAPAVRLSSDGLVLKYTVRDTDPTICFDPGNSGATRVDIQERVLYNVPLANGGGGPDRGSPIPFFVSPIGNILS